MAEKIDFPVCFILAIVVSIFFFTSICMTDEWAELKGSNIWHEEFVLHEFFRTPLNTKRPDIPRFLRPVGSNLLVLSRLAVSSDPTAFESITIRAKNINAERNLF